MTETTVSLAALRLAEERACGRYLIARKAMLAAARRGLSLMWLSDQHPARVDYRDAALTARVTFREAEQRTDRAYQAWAAAQNRYDSAWTATEGRKPRGCALVDGQAA